jgi:hypothetical protein
MALANLDLMLVGVFIGVLICVLAMIALQLACPSTTAARDELFRSGAIYPYMRVTSLRLSALLPWHSAPSFTGCHPVAPVLLVVARLGTVIAVVSLILLGALGLSRVAA